ncbi:MAG: hypothetical protein KAV00_02045 [Phycisphaerae bacterium]|nr:hypothetical protein [Phycisphaerae bacterium]
MMHELVAHSPHLVQPMMEYHRAAVHDNFGLECVDEADVPCTAWPWIEWSGDGNTCGLVVIGGAIRGFFGEGFFYHGTWPQEDEQLQCRKFYHNALRSTTVMSRGSNTIFLTSATQGDGCGADWLVPGAGHVVKSDCGAGFSHVNDDVPGEDSPEGYAYARWILGDGDGCARLFDHVSVVSANPEFKNREGVDPHDVDLHNAILAKVRTPGTFEGIEFDRLDHEAREGGNPGLGRFSRTWDGTGYTDGIMDPRLPVVRTYPASRTKWFAQPVAAELVIVKVWFILDLALPHTKTIITGGRRDFIEPHCVARIHVWLGLRATIDGDNPDVYVDYTNSPHWPDITPDGNELLLAQEPGKWEWPPAFVEWRGVLNNASNPTLHNQDYPQQVGEDNEVDRLWGRMLKSACTALGTWRVPGAPVQMDHNPDDPNQHWIGEICFNFTDSDEYRLCVA